MEINDVKLQKYRDRVQRKIDRNIKRIEVYKSNKDNLSVHGHWSLGYHLGITSELENLLDDIDELMGKEIK
jgi:hypothetical protein